MDKGEEFTKIDDLKRRLYSKGEFNQAVKRSILPNRYRNLKTSWSDLPEEHPLKKAGSFDFLYQVLLVCALFFAGTLAVAGFVLLRGSNIVSKKNIDVVLNVPQTAKAGDLVSLQLTITNRNKLPIQNAVLNITYPTDTKVSGNVKAVISKRPVVEVVVDKINPGETIQKNLEVTFFGQENETKDINAVLSYKVAGSQALYTKEVAANLKINSPPATLAIDVVPEAVAGEVVSLNLKITSNAEAKLAQTLLFVEWPNGFTLDKTTPDADFGDNVFNLGDLAPNQVKDIKITGRLDGQPEDLKTFHFRLGSGANLNDDLDVVYADTFKAVAIKQPFVALTLNVNQSTAKEIVVDSDANVNVTINYTNNLADSVRNADVLLRLNGSIIDPLTVSTEGGFFDDKTSTIKWTRVSNPGLAELSPGEKGQLIVNFRTKSLLGRDLNGVTNPTFNLEAVLAGERVSTGFSKDPIETKVKTNAKVKTVFQLAAKALKKTGELGNTGPLPPKVGQESTYTIVWSIANSSSAVEGAVVKAVLPLGVRFTGNFSPENENLSLNSVSNEITWNHGRDKPGDGAVREVSFQIGITPTLEQVGAYLPLTGEVNYSGTDSFTQSVISGIRRPLDTKINEPGYSANDGKVVK